MKKANKGRKVLGFVLGGLVLAFAVFVYVKYYFVFGVGVKTGELNYVVYKGYVFKTYEGKMVQSGFQTDTKKGSLHSNEFLFSIDDQEIALKLMKECEGKEVTLQYKEYLGALPWRGYSRFVVDKIVSVKNIDGGNGAGKIVLE